MIMNENVLNQRRLFKKINYKIAENGVEIKETTPLHTVNSKVPFEAIANEPKETMISSKLFFWAMIFFWVLTIIVIIVGISGGDVEGDASFIWGGLGVLFTILFFTSREKFLVFKAAPDVLPLVVYKDKPDKDVLASFIENVQSKKREFLRNTYLPGIMEIMASSAIPKLTRLKEMGAITQDEFEKLKTEVVNRTGFSGNLPPSSN
jgi:hypothetical protein